MNLKDESRTLAVDICDVQKKGYAVIQRCVQSVP